MRHLLGIVVVATMLSQSATTAASDDAASQSNPQSYAGHPEANRLLVEAINARDKARGAEPIEALRMLEVSLELIDKIRSDYPESPIAVLIATGQDVGTFSVKQLSEEREEAFSRACLLQKSDGCHSVLVARLIATQNMLQEAKEKLSDARSALTEEQRISEAAQKQTHLLSLQIADLHRKLSDVSGLLDQYERRDKKAKDVIADLDNRLNRALASQVHQLARYRSAFFGRLRDLMADQNGIWRDGDRFVFQSEVLFGSGSDQLGVAGQIQLTMLAETLRSVSSKIPDDINWVLRIDGHTDSRPINTPRFPSNWELSAARSIAVAKFLTDQGIPANRLAPTGFAAFHPLEPGVSTLALRRNRRIELKLTQR